ncbi:barstar family protein [Microbacterium sp. M1A1_1b]
MTTFSTDDVLSNRLDFEIARDDFVRRFQGVAAVREAETWLRREGYRVLDMDAGRWLNDRQMLSTFASALSFPSSFGMNLDALDDCMSDVAEAAYGWDPSETGLVLVLHGFDRMAEQIPRPAAHLQDILQKQGRYAALFGHRLLTILA